MLFNGLLCMSVLLYSTVATPDLADRDTSSDPEQPPAGEAFYTLDNGCPIANPALSLRVGNRLGGPLLIQDTNLIEDLAHFDRERVPERILHARGNGAWGEFEVTNDITNYTDAAFLKTVGKKTKVFFRSSLTNSDSGSPEATRDSRGLSFKLYTEEGNLDWMAFGLPTFFIRDPGKLTSVVHAQQRNPQTNLPDNTAFWDFFSQNPEGFNTLMALFSDMGTPRSYRYMDGFLVNTFRFTKADGSNYYNKLFFKTNQGVKNNTIAEATAANGQNPDGFTRDLFEAIAAGQFPSWNVSAQIIPEEEALDPNSDIFDATRSMSQTKYPLIPFGRITLNENVNNSFAEAEQSVFRVAAVIPGWDALFPVLQTRMFTYGDTQRYRVGINAGQLPVNRPLYAFGPTKRNGRFNIKNYGPQPAYLASQEPTAQKIIPPPNGINLGSPEPLSGTVTEYLSQSSDADFVQPREQWAALGELGADQQDHFVSNVAAHLSQASGNIRNATYNVFTQIDPTLGALITNATESAAVNVTSTSGIL